MFGSSWFCGTGRGVNSEPDGQVVVIRDGQGLRVSRSGPVQSGPGVYRGSFRLVKFQRGRDLDTISDSARHRAGIGMYSMGTLRLFFKLRIRVHPQVIGHMNTFDDQYLAIFSNFALGCAFEQTIASRDAARFQRATEGAGQSSGRGGHHHVQGGHMRIDHLVIDAIMFGDLGVHAEIHGIIFCREGDAAQSAFDSFYLDVRYIHHIIAHQCLSFVFVNLTDSTCVRLLSYNGSLPMPSRDGRVRPGRSRWIQVRENYDDENLSND